MIKSYETTMKHQNQNQLTAQPRVLAKSHQETRDVAAGALAKLLIVGPKQLVIDGPLGALTQWDIKQLNRLQVSISAN